MLRSDNNGVGFRIEFTLGSPVLDGFNPLYLDALLGAVNNGVDFLTDSHGIKMGSQVFFEPYNVQYNFQVRGWTRHMPFMLTMSERVSEYGVLRDAVRIGGFINKPVSGTGRLKNYGGTLEASDTLRWYKKAVAWGVGDIEQVREIANKIHHLGRKVRLGYGAVTKLTIIEDETAHVHWKKRALPAADFDVDDALYARNVVAIKGPYWDANNRRDAKVYIGECPVITPLASA